MPLPTSLPETAESAFQRVVGLAQSVASNAKGVRDLIANAGPVMMDNLIGLYQNFNGAQAVGMSIQGVEGLNDHAREVLNDPAYDINAAFMGSIIACKAVTDWLLANMPSDGNGGFIGWRHQDDGSIQRVTVPVADLAPLLPLLDTAIATFG